MSEQNQAAWFLKWLQEGAQRACDAVTPPESARKHFRESRVEFLRGIREIIDHRIERISREPGKGSHVVVE